MDPKTNVRYLTRVIPNGEIRYIFINMIMKSDLLMGMPEYYLKPNREGGFGRSGPMVILVSRRKEAFIFEFKKAQDIGLT